MDQRFDKPVSVMLGVNMTFTVDRPARAAEILLRQWPTRSGPKHLAAHSAVMKSLQHPDDAERAALARQAFEDAAREADILVEHHAPRSSRR